MHLNATTYAADPRRLFTIEGSFSSKTGTVEVWKTVSLAPHSF